jgi:hypothetical protein
VILANWEIKILEARRAVIWGKRWAGCWTNPSNFTRHFQDVNLDFAGSVDLTKELLTAIGSSRGLVDLEQVAEVFHADGSEPLVYRKKDGAPKTWLILSWGAANSVKARMPRISLAGRCG